MRGSGDRSRPDLESWVEDRTGRLLQIMGPAGEDGLDLAQDARTLVARLNAGQQAGHQLGQGRGGYLNVLDGELRLGEETRALATRPRWPGPRSCG